MPSIGDNIEAYAARFVISLGVQNPGRWAGWIDYILQKLFEFAAMDNQLVEFKEFLIQVHSDIEARLGDLQ
jgi:hypothetical protein